MLGILLSFLADLFIGWVVIVGLICFACMGIQHVIEEAKDMRREILKIFRFFRRMVQS